MFIVSLGKNITPLYTYMDHFVKCQTSIIHFYASFSFQTNVSSNKMKLSYPKTSLTHIQSPTRFIIIVEDSLPPPFLSQLTFSEGFCIAISAQMFYNI